MLSLLVVVAFGPAGGSDRPFPRDTLAHVVRALRAIGYVYAPNKNDPTKGILSHAGFSLPGHLGVSSVSGRAWPSDGLCAIGLDLILRKYRPVVALSLRQNRIASGDIEVIDDAPEGLDARFMFYAINARKTLIGGWADIGRNSTNAATRKSLDWLWKTTIVYARTYGYPLASGRKRRQIAPRG